MTNYSELSDFEINVRVASYQGAKDQFLVNTGKIDYCNRPEQAWPIIVANKIDITFDPDTGWSRAQGPRGHDCFAPVDNPLRAAMIVYLMMQEQKA